MIFISNRRYQSWAMTTSVKYSHYILQVISVFENLDKQTHENNNTEKITKHKKWLRSPTTWPKKYFDRRYICFWTISIIYAFQKIGQQRWNFVSFYAMHTYINIIKSSYIHSGISHIGKMVSFYWTRVLLHRLFYFQTNEESHTTTRWRGQ